MASKGGYKKILFKKVSGLTILLVLLILGVFAVVFNKFYLSPRAMIYQGNDGGCPRDECTRGKCVSGWYYECASHGYKVNGSTCIYKSYFKTAKRC